MTNKIWTGGEDSCVFVIPWGNQFQHFDCLDHVFTHLIAPCCIVYIWLVCWRNQLHHETSELTEWEKGASLSGLLMGQTAQRVPRAKKNDAASACRPPFLHWWDRRAVQSHKIPEQLHLDCQCMMRTYIYGSGMIRELMKTSLFMVIRSPSIRFRIEIIAFAHLSSSFCSPPSPSLVNLHRFNFHPSILHSVTRI